MFNSFKIIKIVVILSFISLSAFSSENISEEQLKSIKKISDSINLAKGEYTGSIKNHTVEKKEEYEEANLFIEQVNKIVISMKKDLSENKKNSFLEIEKEISDLEKIVKDKEDDSKFSSLVLDIDNKLESFSGTTLKELPSSKPHIENGKKIFMQNCATCHGVNADGKGVASVSFEVKPPSFLDTEFIREKSPYTLYRAIKNGMIGTLMPSWEYQLSIKEKWDVIQYIRSVSKEKDSDKKGKELYNKYSEKHEIKSIIDFNSSSDTSDKDFFDNLKKDNDLKSMNDNDLYSIINFVRDEKTIYSNDLIKKSNLK